VMDALWQHATLQQGPSLTIHERSHLSRSGVGHRKRRDDSGDAWMGALRRLFRLGGWGQRCFLRSRSMCRAAYCYCIHLDLRAYSFGGPGRASILTPPRTGPGPEPEPEPSGISRRGDRQTTRARGSTGEGRRTSCGAAARRSTARGR